MALGASLEHMAQAFENKKAMILASTLNEAIAKFLESNKSPSRKVNEIDNRGSHFYLAMFWAEAIANQKADISLAETFEELSATLQKNEKIIEKELLESQGEVMNLGGYYSPDPTKAETAMRPSKTLNLALERFQNQ